MGWLKPFSEKGDDNWLSVLNILSKLVTLEVSHAPTGWLNAELSKNMPRKLSTLEVSQQPMGWLKTVAPANMPS